MLIIAMADATASLRLLSPTGQVTVTLIVVFARTPNVTAIALIAAGTHTSGSLAYASKLDLPLIRTELIDAVISIRVPRLLVKLSRHVRTGTAFFALRAWIRIVSTLACIEFAFLATPKNPLIESLTLTGFPIEICAIALFVAFRCIIAAYRGWDITAGKDSIVDVNISLGLAPNP